MSGHSKWSTIKRQKEAKDQKRGVVFTKLARAITIAVRKGGSSDPEMNFALRLAIDKARAANMPKENIQRAIERGAGEGEGSDDLKEAVYEGFGPQKVAILVEVLTDNTNRTLAEMKKIFEKRGVRLVSPGSAAYLFQKIGLVAVAKGKNAEETMLKIIDLGAEDVEEAEDAIETYIAPEKLAQFKNLLAQAGLEIKEMEIMMRPKVSAVIKDSKTAQKILELMDVLNSHDDVQKTWANFDIQIEN
jgi:YebC/PmpR family DNA-binding regulatory protein